MYHFSTEGIALAEATDYTPKKINVIREPFEHIIVDDFFKPALYEQFTSVFDAIQKRGVTKSKTQAEDRFHAFDMDYDGYVYSPRASLDASNPFRFFYTLEWNYFFEDIFNVSLGFETNFALHHHPPGDRTGFVHHDYVARGFNPANRLSNGVLWSLRPPHPMNCARKIAILTYLDDGSWREGDGGETALYAKDKETIVGKVAPRKNRLFAFNINETSYHAFQTNRRDRNSLIQWFHVPLDQFRGSAGGANEHKEQM